MSTLHLKSDRILTNEPIPQAVELVQTCVSNECTKGTMMLNTFFTSSYRWYGCSECQRYYALTIHEIAYDEERYCPNGHSMKDVYLLSKQQQELTCLWGLFTALYFEQQTPKPWVSFLQMELGAQFQRALKERQDKNN